MRTHISAPFTLRTVAVCLCFALCGSSLGVSQNAPPLLLRRPAMRTGLLVVALLVTGHFAAYTYVRPVLEEVAGARPGQIGTVLLVSRGAGRQDNGATEANQQKQAARLADILAGSPGIGWSGGADNLVPQDR